MYCYSTKVLWGEILTNKAHRQSKVVKLGGANRQIRKYFYAKNKMLWSTLKIRQGCSPIAPPFPLPMIRPTIFDKQNLDQLQVLYEKTLRQKISIVELLAIRQLRQSFLPSNFCAMFEIVAKYFCLFYLWVYCYYICSIQRLVRQCQEQSHHYKNMA